MRILLNLLGALVVAVAAVLGIGALLPVAHTASVRATYRATPPEVFEVISDVASAPEWRDDIDRVEVVRQTPLTWRETGSTGTLTLERVRFEPDRLISARIADRSQGFGGTWTYRLEPAQPGGTALTITEDGEVYSPFFRFMARFVFGHHATMEAYARALGRRFGEDVTPERVLAPAS